VRLPNRILMGSMHTGLEARPDGIERLSAFYVERARGGAALIVTGGFSPNDEGELGPHRAQFSTRQTAIGTGRFRTQSMLPAAASCCSFSIPGGTAITSASLRPRQ
jgi:2,4-dienoyl-CoA reductase-like NADH-dependent reductase (Old Yellow Enzyme family)